MSEFDFLTEPKPKAPEPPTKTEVVVASEAEVQSMQPSALVFLDDPIARKLAVAWAACRGDEAVWLSAAGLTPTSQIRALQSALKINGICRTDGTTDPLAIQYISAIAAEPLQRLKRGNKNDRT